MGNKRQNYSINTLANTLALDGSRLKNSFREKRQIASLKVVKLPKAGMHAFRHGCNRRWEIGGMNPAVLRQQMGHSSHAVTVRHTGQIPLEQVKLSFGYGNKSSFGKYGK